jgi:biotin transport system substrate-specific component
MAGIVLATGEARTARQPVAAPGAAGWLKKGGIAIAGTLFLAACSHGTLPLPWTLVPLNVQPFGVLLLALVFGPAMGTATAVLYLLEGAAGLPVFSPHGPGGIAQLLGPTGGYLMSYPLAAWVAGQLGSRKAFASALGAAVAADAVVLASGTVWLGLVLHLTVRSALAGGALPFLAGDFLKCVAAAGLASASFLWQRKKN